MALDADVEKECNVLRVCIGITGEYSKKYKNQLYAAPQYCFLVVNDELYCGLPATTTKPSRERYFKIRDVCSIVQEQHLGIKIELVNGKTQWKNQNGELVVVAAPDLYEIPQHDFALLSEILSHTP